MLLKKVYQIYNKLIDEKRDEISTLLGLGFLGIK